MDREKILEDFEYVVRKSHGEGWDYVDGLTTEDGFKILQLLKEQEAVRCIDCEYHRHDDWCTELHRETKQNDYCSWGVKKDE
jgi:hypothetical protein